jgi:hypothetical protein
MAIKGRHGIFIELVIRWTVWMAVFNFSMAYILSAQEPHKEEVNDTLIKKPPANQYLLHSLYTDMILSSSLSESSISTPGFLHQSLTYFPSSLSSQFQQQIDVVSPWKQELDKEKEYRTLTFILQAVNAGGTVYFLYEHIKKYGSKY